ncbi:hydroxyacid dehydrogenase [Kribbella sp.]|uniref:hydroxyacid dehydrogenase n=1 Tax=Kribbella sp. TaxID=1871183 RepID=UPI002D707588|nr:hydroxyacid dehydrogenase [Kribbella sp.]HZX02148.1 hydroxyacid dehydrogenase [Kribbella sp.]
MPKPRLAALMSPERAADVVDAATRRLLDERFEVVWADAQHAAGPAQPGKPPGLDPAAVAELADGAEVLLTSWGTPRLGKELWAAGGPKVVAHAAGPAQPGKPPGLDPAAVAELAAGAEVLLTSWGTPRLGKELWAAGGPKVVAHAAGTVKNLVEPGVLAQGVGVFSAGPRIAWSVGEYCLGAMLTLARRLARFDGAVRGGGWKQTEYRGHELAGAKVGIVGASSTARALITMLKPFGCDLAVYDPYLNDARAAELGVRTTTLDDAASAPFLSIHVPNVPETKGMITRALIENLPDCAVVVNSSRGPAIDQQALLDHALDGRIYAALDVYDPEPPTFDEHILRSENLLLTPHIAGDTAEGHLALAGYVVRDALKWLEDGTRGPSFVDSSTWSIAA